MATSIGANGDRHWRPLAPFKWRHLIHSMAILSSQSPFRVSGSFCRITTYRHRFARAAPAPRAESWTSRIVDVQNRGRPESWTCIARQGSFGDPMAPIDPVAPLTTMATMAIHLQQWCNGDNGANSDDGDPLVPMATKATMATMAPMAPMTSMATMVQNLIMTAALATMVPMTPMAPVAIVIAIGTTHRIAIRANGTAIVAIGVIGVIGAIGPIITNGSP